MKAEHKLSIHELLARAASCFDAHDLHGLERCFTSTAKMSVNIAGSGPIGPFDGREAIMQLMKDAWAAQTDQRRHIISNIFFEEEESTSATAVSNLVVFSVEDGDINSIISGVYRDKVIRTGDDWQIANRHLDLDLPF